MQEEKLKTTINQKKFRRGKYITNKYYIYKKTQRLNE